MASKWEIGSAMGSVVAAGAALFALSQSADANRNSAEAVEQAEIANGHAAAAVEAAATANQLAQANEDRLGRQEANKVYIGEPPTSSYGRHPAPEGQRIWIAVVNTSSAQIENTWVADDEGRSIKIEGVQRCHLYALEPGFRPTDLYFSDSSGIFWHRHREEQIEQVAPDAFPLPDRDTGGDSPWDEPVDSCTG